MLTKVDILAASRNVWGIEGLMVYVVPFDHERVSITNRTFRSLRHVIWVD